MKIEFKFDDRPVYTVTMRGDDFYRIINMLDLFHNQSEAFDLFEINMTKDEVEELYGLSREAKGQYIHLKWKKDVPPFKQIQYINIIKPYRDEVLACADAGEAYRDEFYVEDFINIPALVYLIGEIILKNVILTDLGRDFMTVYYGYHELTEIMQEHSEGKFQNLERQDIEAVLRDCKLCEVWESEDNPRMAQRRRQNRNPFYLGHFLEGASKEECSIDIGIHNYVRIRQIAGVMYNQYSNLPPEYRSLSREDFGEIAYAMEEALTDFGYPSENEIMSCTNEEYFHMTGSDKFHNGGDGGTKH